jgi:hypothetical protein
VDWGNYVEGLEQAAEKILNYFGPDFIAPEMKQHVLLSMQQAMMSQFAFQMPPQPMFHQPIFPLISA